MLVLAGCSQPKADESWRRDLETLPPLAEFVESYNWRPERLDKVWARGFVSLRWIDEQGEEQYEQGDTHLQIDQPLNLGLSVHKLGEKFAWIGSNDNRYWFFELHERKVAYVGRHDLLTPEKLSRLGLPVTPSQLMTLAGIATLPTDLAAIDAELSISETGDMYRLIAPAIEGEWTWFIEPVNYYPTEITYRDGDDRLILRSTLEDYESVRQSEPDTRYPFMASRIRIEHVPSGATLTLGLGGMTDDKVQQRVFDFDVLVQALRPDEVIDLDTEDLETAAK